jgi:hypothetical protein
MNRRSFLAFSAAAALSLALHGAPTFSASAAPPQISHQHPGSAAPARGLKLNFGPDLRLLDVQQSDGVWYARLEHNNLPGQPIVLKSYNGRAWGSLDWNPRRTARSRI